MRPAAVGFQCPSCVKEGARETRSGRTAYGGRRTDNPMRTTQVLIGINVAVWVAILLTGWRSSALARQLELRQQPVDGFLTNGTHVAVDGVAQAPWELLTSMFAHVEIWHLGFNMVVLYALGPQLEAALGRVRFLAVYLVSGLAGGALVIWAGPSFGGTLGASGAIFGLMGALLVVALKVQGDVRGILTWIAINFVITFLFGFISWQAHVGGFVAGVLLGGAIVYAPRRQRTLWQVAGIALVTLVVAVATVTRIVVLA